MYSEWLFFATIVIETLHGTKFYQHDAPVRHTLKKGTEVICMPDTIFATNEAVLLGQRSMVKENNILILTEPFFISTATCFFRSMKYMAGAADRKMI